ncbi:MAG: MCE family protein [Methyloprofundus sp.]|nr:MCE family protein [Methyloprofundus sp.]
MSKQANPTLIGVFVLGAIMIATIGITIFGSGRWFSEKSEFVIYFDESVNGLSIGALVKMQGVPIGAVTDIQVQLDPNTKKILTPVFIEIEHQKYKQLLQFEALGSEQGIMQQLVGNGLRMQLQYTSLVTGKLYIESLLKPESPVKLLHLNTQFTELPSITSSSQKVQKNLADAMQEFQKIPFQEVFVELLVTIKSIKKIAESEDLQLAIYGFAASLKELQGILTSFNRHSDAIALHAEKTLKHSGQAMQKLDQSIEPLMAEVQTTLASANHTLANTDKTLAQFSNTAEDVGAVFSDDALLQQNLNNTLDELARSAKSLRRLTDYLQRHPEALIRGKGR